MTSVNLARMLNCPSCGRPLQRPRQSLRPVEPASPVDTSALSNAELFRHFKQTAPVDDLRFFLRHTRLSPALQAAGEALLAAGCRETGGTLSRADWYRRLTALQDRWRQETTDAAVLAVSDAVKEVA